MRDMKEKLKRLHITRAGQRICLLLLCLVMVGSLLPTSAFAADGDDLEAMTLNAPGKTVTDPANNIYTYVLSVLYGNMVSDQVLYYAVRYTDENNAIHSEFLMPNIKQDPTQTYTHTQGDVGVGVTAAMYDLGEKNCFLFSTRNVATERLGRQLTEINALPAAQAQRTTEFYFKTYYPIKTVESFEILTRYAENGVNEIGIQDMRLYEVDTLYNVEYVGGVSNEVFFQFTGNCLAYATFQRTLSWEGSDKLFQIKPNSKDQFLLHQCKEAYDSRNAGQLLFEIDFADVYGAGFETLSTPYGKLTDKDFPELCAMEVVYADANGFQHTADIPVVTSTMLTAYREFMYDTESHTMQYPYNVDRLKGSIDGIMQQGQKAVFAVNLPGFESVISSKFIVGAENACKAVGFQDKAHSSFTQRMTSAQYADGFSYSGIFIYDSACSRLSTGIQDNQLRCSVKGNPLYTSLAVSYEGTLVNDKAQTAIQLRAADPKQTYNIKKQPGNFLITLYTDDMAAAGTTEAITCSLTYKALDGRDRRTPDYDVTKLVKDYYGYWPGSGGDVCYTYAAGPSGKLAFLIDVGDIDYFTGITIALPARGATDDWQIKDIKIYEIEEFGSRSVEFGSLKNATGQEISDRLVTRNHKYKDISPSLKEPALVLPGSPVTVSFVSGESSIGDNEVDWSDSRWNMSYQTATEYFGFEKTRATYTVKVDVAGDVVNNELDDNCGSKNHFYFQLVFEEGVSGYVLANQQLTSDGFISGQEATFTISTNMDYGGVTAIRVIPENVSENTDTFDKLKVNSISVIKEETGGLSKTWKAVLKTGQEQGQWIGIDYHDEGEKDSIYGQQGRNESEIAHVFPVTQKGYSLKALVCLTTDSFLDERIEGEVMFIVNYTNSANENKEMKVNLAEAIAKYANRAVEYQEYENTSWDTKIKCAALDYNYMLRDNHTDRFTVELTDVVKINYVRLDIKSVTSGRWRVSSVQLYEIKEEGALALNSQNEYQHRGKIESICSSVEPMYEIQYFNNGAGAQKGIDLTDNKINIEMQTGGWTSTITSIPLSKDDTLNIYAHVSSSKNPISTYQLKGSLDYSVVTVTTEESQVCNDQPFSTATILNPYPAASMYYALGLKASGINTITKLSLMTNSVTPEMCKIDYVIVEQVRSGVVIRTFYLDGRYQDAEYGCVCYPSSASDAEGKQVVTFQTTADSLGVTLQKDSNDLAFCLNYTSPFDPSGKIYATPYYFLSDFGYTSVKPNQIVEIAINQKYIKDVVGVTFAATGQAGGKVKVRCATVSNYSVEGMTETLQNTYCFATEMKEAVTIAPRTVQLTDSTSDTAALPDVNLRENVARLKFNFKTAAASESGSSGTSKPIRLDIVYDVGAYTRTLTLENMRDYLVAGDFNAGSTATVEVMIPDFDSIRYVELTPYDENDDKMTSWKIDSMTADIVQNGNTEHLERPVNKTAYSDSSVKVGLANIVIDVKAYYPKLNENGTASDTMLSRNYRSGSTGETVEMIGIEQVQTIEFRPTVSGSISGVTVKCFKVVGNGVTEMSDMLQIHFSTDSIDSVIMNPGENFGQYYVSFVSEENERVFVNVYFNINEPKEPEKEEPKEDKPVKPEDTEKTEESTEPGKEEPAKTEEPSEPSEPVEP